MCFASLSNKWVLPHWVLMLKAYPGLGIGAEILYKIEILNIFYLQGKGEQEYISHCTCLEEYI